MDKKELQEAESIIDALYFDVKVLNAWQHTLLQNVISIAETKLRQPDVSGRSEQLVICKKCGSSEMYQYTKTKDKCEECGNIQDY